jgi:SAM-dependent methyltransferase
MSATYDFIIDLARAHCPPPARLLDVGCGGGQVVRNAARAGYDAWGVDTFQDVWMQYAGQAAAALGDRLRVVSPGENLPFEDRAFDLVLSNQVFEHIADLPRHAAEIARVLRPGGVLIAIFPTREVVIEPHLRAPFVHRAPNGSARQRMLLGLAHGLGCTSAPRAGRAEWIASATDSLSRQIFYRRCGDIPGVLAPWFSVKDRAEPWFMRDRLRRSSRMRALSGLFAAPAFDPLLRFLCLRLANAVFVLRRNQDGPDKGCYRLNLPPDAPL